MRIPKTVEEAYVVLDTMLDPNDFAEVTNREGMVAYHNNLGRWIRNNWGFWLEESSPLKDWFVKQGYKEPDDMSGALLEGYWCNKYQIDFDYKAALCRFHPEVSCECCNPNEKNYFVG